uniref:Protein krueppel n=1 Tax=Panagrellus redivivus TaxID=6233 RepID=A0A7E4V9W9_PANRE
MSFCLQPPPPPRVSTSASSTTVSANGTVPLLSVETRPGPSSSVGLTVDDSEPMEEDFRSVSAASMHSGSNKTIVYSPTPFQLGASAANFRPQSPVFQISCDGGPPQEAPERNVFCRTPPLICEQGPSAPSSPTSPGGRRKPNSLHVDALQRLDLLSPSYIPSMDYSKLSPLSPSYPTSDLGSSPRSSISIAQSGLGPHWTSFRDFKKSSSDYDADSDICSKDLLSPGTILSPAPFSPFSDCGDSETPYSQRSPNLSPMPVRSGGFHFSFEQLRSRSSMSNRAEGCINGINNLDLSASLLDADARERSRSEGEMLQAAKDEMDTTINCSTVSVPVSNRVNSRKRGLTPVGASRVPEAHERLKHFHQSSDSVTTDASTCAGTLNRLNTLSSVEDDQELLASVSTQVSRQPTIEEPPPDPTFEEICRRADLDSERSKQVEDWLKQQAAALEILRSSLAPVQQDTSNLLRVPGAAPIHPALLAPPQTDMHELAKLLAEGHALSAQQKQSLWRRSRSETDVSVASTGPTSTSQELAFVCEHCGQAFAMHDRLAKHIASRHRDRSASVNDESTKTHKCTICPKSFGRSDMLTRHMRLHTGVKPYSCLICGQVFSRSDHLSTHQRTHTGEKPYRCPHCCYSASRRDMITRHMRTHLRPDGTPIPPGAELQMNLSQISLNSRSPLLTPEPQASNQPPSFPITTASSPAGSLDGSHFQIPRLTTQATVSNDGSDNVAFANAALSNLINSAQQQMKLANMGRSLDAQITSDFLRRSTPNLPGLLGIQEHPPPNFHSELAAAFASKMNPFMLPSMSQPPQPGSISPTPGTATTSEMLNAAVAAAAQQQHAAAVQQHLNLLTAASSGANGNPGLTLPPGLNLANGNPLLARQSSIGGFGFS